MTYVAEPDARIIADSIPPGGPPRLTTMQITIHRFVLAEFNTHRVFSRNSASSRAIPLETMLQRCGDNPAFPLALPAEQPGMSGGDHLEGKALEDAMTLIQTVWENTIAEIDYYIQSHPDKATRLHKSVVNRLLEPFMWHTIIVTSSEWDNFFSQRCTPQAQPEIRATAELMRDALESSSPKHLGYGDWHLPFVGLNPDDGGLSTIDKLKVSAARCARVSYLTHDGQRSVEADLKLFDETLAKYGHWSPLEHVATPLIYPQSMHVGNFGHPWVQLRAMVEQFGGGTLDAAQFTIDSAYHPVVGGYIPGSSE